MVRKYKLKEMGGVYAYKRVWSNIEGASVR